MSLTLRSTLLTILLTLLVITLSALGFSSYYYGQESAKSLLAQVVDEMAKNVYGRMHDLIDAAADGTRLNLELLRSGALVAEDYPRLVDYWLDVMKVKPEITLVYLTLEADGGLIGVARKGDTLYVQEVGTDPTTGQRFLKEYNPEDYPQKPYLVSPDHPTDYRTRPWYVTAREAGTQTWTDTYIFLGPGGFPDVPGASNVAPFFGPDGNLQGVVASDIDVRELCSYLSTLNVGKWGFAFVVELLEDDRRVVIAHPNQDMLLSGEAGGTDLVGPSAIADLRVRRLMEQLPATIARGDDAQVIPVSFSEGKIDYIGGCQYVTGKDTPEWLVCIVRPRNEVMAQVRKNNVTMLTVGLAILALALLVTLYVAGQVARPLESIATETESIARLEIERRPQVHSVVLEVDRLGEAMEEMKTGLRSFSKYVPEKLVRSLVESGIEAKRGGEKRTITVSFSDIVGFTSISEGMTPDDLFTHLGEYFSELSAKIHQNRGTVDKYIGDSIMAFWGAPEPNPRHAVDACAAALSSQAALRELRAVWRKQGRPEFRAGFGLNTGEVIVGNLGSERRLNYTVIGDAVNLASRLEGLNRIFGTEILLSEFTYQEVRQDVVTRPLDWVAVKGKTKGVLVHELIGLRGEVGQAELDLEALYASALDDYRGQRWDRATGAFERVLEMRPGDGPARIMRDRCRSYLLQGPRDDWDGIHRLATK